MYLLLSREHVHLLLVAHQVVRRSVNMTPVETSIVHFAIRGDLVQDKVHPVLFAGERKVWDDSVLKLRCSHGLELALKLRVTDVEINSG